MRWRAVGASLGVAILLAGCGGGHSSPRRGLIVPQHSIDRLELGMTQAQVRRVYGDPESVVELSESESGKTIVDWHYDKRGTRAEFRQVKGERMSLAGLFTTSGRERTSSGVGVGSSEDELRRALSGVDCAAADPGQRWCTLGGDSLGSAQTVFVVRAHRVSEVRVLLTFQ